MSQSSRHAIVKKCLEKYSLGVVDAENSLVSYNSYFRNMGFQETIESLVQKKISENANQITPVCQPVEGLAHGKAFDTQGNGKAIKVMDIGCGNAGFLKDMKTIFGGGIKTIGIDLAKPLTTLGQNPWPDVFLQGDALKVDFPKGVDLVFSFRALHEIGEPEKIIEKAYNSLASRGRAFLSFRTMDLLAGGKGLAELQAKEIRALLKMVRSRKLKGFKVNGFEVTVKGEDGKKLTAGINVFLEK